MAGMSREIIEAAIEGLESKKQRCDQLITELRAQLNGDHPAAPATTGKRKLSVASIQKMREAQKRRWAKVRADDGKLSTTESSPKRRKRKLSAAGRKAIAEAQRKRWAAKKAATDA